MQIPPLRDSVTSATNPETSLTAIRSPQAARDKFKHSCGEFIVLQPPSRNDHLEHLGLPRMVLHAHPQTVLQDKVPRAVLSLKQRLFLAALSEQFPLP